MAINRLHLYSLMLVTLICYTEIHQAHANSIQCRSCDIVRCPAGTNCVNGKCVTSCDDVVCYGQGQECVYEYVDCFTSPCPPIPTCKPINRCKVVRCSAGFTCNNGSCVKDPTCDGVVCDPGQQCELQVVQCFTTPCPPIPTCKPDRCATVRCRSGYNCIDGRCVEEPTCKGFKCADGEECYLENVTCIQAPCLPVPACRPKLTCATIDCIAGFVCVDNQCIPAPAPTCDDVVCEPGTQCYLESEECTTPPCPPPQPVCRASCANILCLAPSTCVNGQCLPIEPEQKEV